MLARRAVLRAGNGYAHPLSIESDNRAAVQDGASSAADCVCPVSDRAGTSYFMGSGTFRC